VDALPEALGARYDPRPEKARSFAARLGKAFRDVRDKRFGSDGIHLELAPCGGVGGASRYVVRFGNRTETPKRSESSETLSNQSSREETQGHVDPHGPRGTHTYAYSGSGQKNPPTSPDLSSD